MVLLTGGAGFVGGHVRQLMTGARPGVRLRLLARSPIAEYPPVPPVGLREDDARRPPMDVRYGDLRDPGSLAGVAEGADALLHCASYTGGSIELATRTNVEGTRALLAEARHAGVRRVVYVSTAAVYGRGPFRDRRHESLPLAPASALSATRTLAEQLVLEHGGTVLRPYLVYGTGDRWVGPRIVDLARRLPGLANGLDALVSMVDVRQLAAAAVELAVSSLARDAPAVYDCNHPVPVPATACLGGFRRLAGLPNDTEVTDYSAARQALLAARQSVHDLDMMGLDHWFDSTRVWQELDLSPGPPFATALSEHADWYAPRDAGPR